MDNESPKFLIEDLVKPTDKELEKMANLYKNFYDFRSQRNGNLRQLKNQSLRDVWTSSRELFWTSTNTKSEDLEALGLDFALPFARKEVLDFTGRLVSLGIVPELEGDDLGAYGVKVLMALQKKWRLKSKDKVNKFWQVLYGTINGTLVTYIGYDMKEYDFRYLTSLSDDRKKFNVRNEKKKKFDDAFSEIVPIEEIYLKKIWERDIQKQGKTIRRQEMTVSDFKAEFPESKYPMAKFVVPTNRIDENSLYFQMLSGTEITDRIEVLTEYDTDNDEKNVVASGIWINKLGKDTPMPNPFAHKSQPYTWTINDPIDEKLAYGMPMPFLIKDMVNIQNTGYTMMVERELRAIDPPIISSDFEAPQLIFGQNRVIPVNDVSAYKEFTLSEPTGAYLTMMNSLQGLTSSFTQGGTAQVAPSRQPKSAREVMEIENMKQKALGNALIMYYDLIHQEMFLLLKTMLQFYVANKHNKKDVLRAFSVSDFPLSRGGVGKLEVRIVETPKDPLDLYFEGVQKSIENGKLTEILEVPYELIENLEFYISNIKLEPEKSTTVERAEYFENVLKPMIETWIPMGLADPSKTFLRHLEKMGESPVDYVQDNQMGQSMTGARGQNVPIGGQTGSINQSTRGIQYGNQNVEALMNKLGQ